MAIKIAGTEVINDNRELVLAKLTEINETKNQTAVDVFIYDTSKDSDGGAWRHRTQHTSWYNESASSTRGSRKEFPAVAVIVAEAGKVTIYDGDDPSLPMWMVFETGGSTYLVNSPLTSLGGLNGVLCVGGLHVYRVDFVSDCALRYLGGRLDKSEGPVSQRNSSVYNTIDNSISLVSNDVNDVAMTVLPDAPTDPATGLEIPTIAVATNGGVSVIKDDGTVVDITCANSSFTLSTLVDFRGGQLWMNQGNGASVDSIFVFNTPPSADTALTLNSKLGTGADADAYYKEHPTLGDLHFVGDSSTDLNNAVSQGSVGSNDGLNLVAEDTTTPANGMVAYVTSSYNTGYQNGDIKLAALADTTAETLSGSELLSAFSDASWTNATEWTYDATNDEWDFAASAGVISALTHTVSTTEGTVYVATATVSNVANVTTNELFLRMEGTADGVVELNKDDGSGAVISQPSGGDGTYTATFTAGASNPYFQIRSSGLVDGDETATLVSASVRLADPDRSVNGNGLAVHGSITKEPVATGADVVAYSGFDSSNYLEQPYNDDLDFGTGDFCVMGWVNLAANSTSNILQQVTTAWDSATSLWKQTRWSLYYYSPTSVLAFQYGTASGSGASVSASGMPIGSWAFIALKYESGSAYLYIDGNLAASAALSFATANAYSRLIAGGPAPAVPSNVAKLALLRISATAPTADQIRKIYEDEKVLFQEDAKATLTGTSDAVTALAHDPDTELLHVGTSGGRSVFQGLRRVDETATAVTTAISAVDGLVVEQ